MHKMVKTYDLCVMNLNQNYVLKTTISMFNSLHICWNLDVTFTLCQARSHGGI